MRNMVLSIVVAALAVGVGATEPAGSATVVTSKPIWNCGDWGCGGNSQIVDGAAINSPAVEGPAIVPARRHQAAQIANTDVVLNETGIEARQNRIRDSQNRRSAVPDARFGEAHTTTPSSLKNGQQLPPSQSKVLVMPLQEQRFGEAWGKNLNSPVIDGAAIL